MSKHKKGFETKIYLCIKSLGSIEASRTFASSSTKANIYVGNLLSKMSGADISVELTQHSSCTPLHIHTHFLIIRWIQSQHHYSENTFNFAGRQSPQHRHAVIYDISVIMHNQFFSSGKVSI